MERDCNSAVLNSLCTGFLRRRSKVQGTLLEVIHQKLRTDLTEGLACLTDGQPIGGDQNHGHSMEVWELGWSNPRQDCSMNHGRVGHSCDGLIHQVFVHPVSHVYSVWGFILTGGLPHLLVS